MSDEIKRYAYKGVELRYEEKRAGYTGMPPMWEWPIVKGEVQLLTAPAVEKLCADGVLQEIKPPEPEFDDIPLVWGGQWGYLGGDWARGNEAHYKDVASMAIHRDFVEFWWTARTDSRNDIIGRCSIPSSIAIEARKGNKCFARFKP